MHSSSPDYTTAHSLTHDSLIVCALGNPHHCTISYDFYAEQMAAPDDLKFLTDQVSTRQCTSSKT